eukprot:4570921-Pyramimonas_sp.AAC.1
MSDEPRATTTTTRPACRRRPAPLRLFIPQCMLACTTTRVCTTAVCDAASVYTTMLACTTAPVYTTANV